MRVLRLFLATGATVFAADPASRALSILQAECGQCHSRAAAMSGLDLSSREGLLEGGSRGPAVNVGNPEASLLLRAVRRQDKLAMPPAKALDADSVAVLKAWIDAGAKWPSNGPAVAAPKHWAFRPVAAVSPPSSRDPWVRNEVDEFVLAAMRKRKLRPAAEASRAALIRRLSFDLTGLPPTAERVRKFVGDSSPDAYPNLVEELLASPRYGEKWGRHWLDLARYSDTAGFELDSYIADAWRYRDWVIDSFNQDKPYDRFIREQIAGDEFFPEDPVAQTGTGLFCVGPNRDLYPDQADINRVEILTDYTDTVSSVFLGLTAGCARCHDHKFDPIPQRDYYRLQAIFAPAVKTKVALNRLTSLGFDVAENVREIKLREIGEQIGAVQGRCRKTLFEAKLAVLEPEIREALRLDDPQRTPRQRELATLHAGKARVSDEEVRDCLDAGERQRLDSIEKRLLSLFAGYRSKPFACGISDVGDYSPKTFIPARGTRAKEAVEPGFFGAIGGGDVAERSFERPTTGPIPLTPTTGRRHALADWLVRPDNPLTARVMVNRIWQFHFGRGIVATPSDFGTRGRAPSHPELLDWMASKFVSGGWSIKKMHRLIVNSAAYRQSANPGAGMKDADPDNVWLTRFARRRLDAEELRDSVLASTGSLNVKMGGRPVVTPLSKEEMFNMIGRADDSWVVTADTREHDRRSVYLFQKRTFRLPVMEVFDAPESMLTCSRRDSSTTAPQSLSLLNGPLVTAQSAGLARKLVAAGGDDRALATSAWRAVLARDPSADELGLAAKFLADQRANTGSGEGAVSEMIRGLLNSNEFLYVE